MARRRVTIDAGFARKSGRARYGLDWFWNGSRGQAERGLEISLLALVDVTHHTAYTLSACQTPALPKAPKASKVPKEDEAKADPNKTPEEPRPTRIDSYLSHLKRDTKPLLGTIRYRVADSYYAKTKFVNGVREHGLHLVSKLRHDADLRRLYNGEQKSQGPPSPVRGQGPV